MTNRSKFVVCYLGGALLLAVAINLGQYVFGLETGSVSSSLNYGLPFAYYEYVPSLSRGRILYLGVVGDALVTLAIGAIIRVAVSQLGRSVDV